MKGVKISPWKRENWEPWRPCPKWQMTCLILKVSLPCSRAYFEEEEKKKAKADDRNELDMTHQDATFASFHRTALSQFKPVFENFIRELISKVLLSPASSIVSLTLDVVKLFLLIQRLALDYTQIFIIIIIIIIALSRLKVIRGEYSTITFAKYTRHESNWLWVWRSKHAMMRRKKKKEEG